VSLRRLARLCLGVLGGLGVLVGLGATHASAQASRAHLSWERPFGSMCPQATVLQDDVEQLLGERVFVPARQAQVILSATVEDRESGVRIVIRASDPEGTQLGMRVLSAPAGECASLRLPLGLVLAMLLDADESSASPASSARVRPRLGLSAGFLSGALPRVTPGAGLVVALDLGRALRLRGDASYWFPVAALTPRDVGARFQAYSAGLGVCPRLSQPERTLTFWLCTGGRVGGLHASPRGLPGAAGQTRLLAQLALELSLVSRVGRRAELELAMGGVASLNRPLFYYERSDEREIFVHRPTTFGAIFRLSLTIHEP